ncbi:hypothetical protein [Aquabacterium sp.]|uniref:DUF7673 family protein n=1 Tax=Aquabacterium sp. TaxID=1872578 RepID=UPI0025C1C1A3|nr:hypothetical protein [Aquabacterium sp.]
MSRCTNSAACHHDPDCEDVNCPGRPDEPVQRETRFQRAARMADVNARILAYFDDEQLAALRRLYELPKRHSGTSGGNTAAKLLLGLYNGLRFPFDLTDLRCFDMVNFEAAMTVIRMDAPRCRAEVHTVLDAIYGDGFSTGDEFEHWAFNLRLKGRCKKEGLSDRPLRYIELEDFRHV